MAPLQGVKWSKVKGTLELFGEWRNGEITPALSKGPLSWPLSLALAFKL